LGRFPSRSFAINAAWLTAVMLAVDLLAWTQTVLLHDHPTLARAEPKTLRYRLLHVAARLGRGGRRLRLRLDQHWPWALQLADAFARCTALPGRPPEHHPRPDYQSGEPSSSGRATRHDHPRHPAQQDPQPGATITHE
jgi:hypothetical protein